MEQHNFKDKHMLKYLVSEYEAMSQKGTVGFLEKKAFLELIDHYEMESQLDKAIEVIEYALLQYSYSTEFYIRKAQLLIEKKCAYQAIACLEHAEILSPSELEIFLFKAEALCSLGNYDEAFELLQALKGKLNKEELSEVLMLEAHIHENLEDFDKMFRSLEDALLANPKNSVALERVWLSVELSAKYQESVKLHNYLIDQDPYSYIAWYNLGHAYACLERYEDAIEAFEYAYIINEKFEFAYRDCGEICLRDKQYHKALKCYNEALEFFEPDSDFLYNIGQCHEFLLEVTTAKSFYKEAILLNPANDLAYYRMGECFVKEKKWKSAIHAYQKALNLEGKREEYIAALAEVYYQIDDEQQARLLFKKAADTAPETTKYWIQYASFLMAVGSLHEALQVLEEAEVYAIGVELLYCRTACEFMLGHRQEALSLLQSALLENYNMHESLFDLVPEVEGDPEVIHLIQSYRA